MLKQLRLWRYQGANAKGGKPPIPPLMHAL
nr:MAG TPA: hypothetical protein [Microviridae sp.]